MSLKSIFLSFCLSSSIAGVCIAQKFTPFGVDSAMNHLKGNIHHETTLEHYFGENSVDVFGDRPISLSQFNTTISRYLLNRFSISGNAFFSIIRGERNIDFITESANTVGTGFSGGIRWEVLNFSHHNFYIETYRGLIFTLDDFPPKGTPINFLVRYGLGYTIHLSDNRYMFFGWRWIHVSNGTGLVHGNPSYDGNGLFLGFKFSKDPKKDK